MVGTIINIWFRTRSWKISAYLLLTQQPRFDSQHSQKKFRGYSAVQHCSPNTTLLSSRWHLHCFDERHRLEGEIEWKLKNEKQNRSGNNIGQELPHTPSQQQLTTGFRTTAKDRSVAYQCWLVHFISLKFSEIEPCWNWDKYSMI